MKMKIKFKRCLVSLLSLSLLFLSCNCLGVNAAEGDNSDGSQNISVTDVTESSGEENTSSGQNTETTEASTESTQVVTDEAESNISYGDDSYVTMAAPEGAVCYMTCNDAFVDYYTDVKVAVDYAKNHSNQGDFIINLLNEQYYFSNSFVDVQNADVTIQPDPTTFGEDKCTLHRGESNQDLFRVQSTATLTLNNLILDGRDKAGNIKRVPARMIWSFGNVNLNNCEFRYAYNLNGPANGGVIRMECDSFRKLTVNDCVFSNNTVEGASADGSAISAHNCLTEVNNTVFENNEVKTTDSNGGGTVYVFGEYKNPNNPAELLPNLYLNYSTFKNNKVTYSSSGMGVESNKRKVGGGAVFITQLARVKMTGCVLTGNEAPSGGGVYLNFGRIDIKDTEITENIAEKIGGGIYFSAHADSKRVSVQGKVIIANNVAQDPTFSDLSEIDYPKNVPKNWGNNVYLQNKDHWGEFAQSISLAGDLTEGSSIGITAMDSVNDVTKGRMSPEGQFGKAISSTLSPTANPDPTVPATTYSGLKYFFRDTNGHDPDGLYLYGGPGNSSSALYGTHAIIWHEGSPPVNDVDFEFIKTDEQGKAFGQNEATFEIMNPDTSSGFTKVYASTDANGKVTFTGLPVNTTYRIYETKTKLHYSLPLGYWTLTVAEGGTFTVEAVSQGGFVPEFAYNETSKTYSLINHPQFQLPLTGGDGTAKIIVIGIVVLCTPILIKLKSFRKKEKSL